MFQSKLGLMEEIRDRFAHVDSCPVPGKTRLLRKRWRRVDFKVGG